MHQQSNLKPSTPISSAVLCVRLCPTQVEDIDADKNPSVPAEYQSDVKSIIQKSVVDHGGIEISSSEYLYQFKFLNSMGALHCAAQIQNALDRLNKNHLKEIIFLASIGIDLVSPATHASPEINVVDGEIAAFLAKSGSPGEISLSEGVYSAVKEAGNYFCRFTKQLAHNGTHNGLNVYEAFWNPAEIEVNQARVDLVGPLDPDAQPIRSFGIKLILLIIIILVLIFSLIAGYKPAMHLLAQLFAI